MKKWTKRLLMLTPLLAIPVIATPLLVSCSSETKIITQEPPNININIPSNELKYTLFKDENGNKKIFLNYYKSDVQWYYNGNYLDKWTNIVDYKGDGYYSLKTDLYSMWLYNAYINWDRDYKGE